MAVCTVTGWITHLEFGSHEIAGAGGCSDEEHLHARVVHGHKVGEQIQIPAAEHHQEEALGPKRQPCRCLHEDSKLETSATKISATAADANHQRRPDSRATPKQKDVYN